MIIRVTEEKDIPACREIYNHEVLHGLATFDTEPKSMEERKAWFDAHNRDHHPLLTAEIDSQVAGYASLSTYRPRTAYNGTVELSVYVSEAFRRHGVARALVKELLTIAKADPEIHNVVSVITGCNTASIALHEQFGFTYVGTLHKVGVKFGQYLDTVEYEMLV